MIHSDHPTPLHWCRECGCYSVDLGEHECRDTEVKRRMMARAADGPARLSYIGRMSNRDRRAA